MKLLNLYTFTALFSTVRPSLIPAKKICKDCRHFIGDNIECRKFGDTNIITGKVTYSSARSVREDNKKCGEDAIHFEENHFKIITVPYYFLKDNWIIFLPSSIIGLYFYALFYNLHNLNK
jgi:hypothetical protein